VEDLFSTVNADWPPGREDYHWHVLPGSELLRDRIARPYAELLATPGLVPVRPANMHITVQRLPPAGQLSTDHLSEITGLVRESCAAITPFTVTASRAEAWEHAIICPVRPGHLLASLRQVTASAYRQVTGGRQEISPAVYYPHLSLAYATRHLETAPVRAWLAASDAPEVAFPVTSLVLVAQQHDRREITFRILDQIPLAGIMIVESRRHI
jgi:2'-5' RNA ligase